MAEGLWTRKIIIASYSYRMIIHYGVYLWIPYKMYMLNPTTK